MTESAQRDGTEAGTAAMLFTGAIAGVLLRGATWFLSAGTIGPVLGFLDTAAVSWSGSVRDGTGGGSRSTLLFRSATARS